MTTHRGPDNLLAGLSDIGQPGTGPRPDEITLLLQRVRESSSDEGKAA